MQESSCLEESSNSQIGYYLYIFQANKNIFCRIRPKNALLFSIVSFLIISAILASCSEGCETDDSQSSIPEQSIIKRDLLDGFPDIKNIVRNPTVIATTDKA